MILTNNYLESPFGQPFAIFFGTLCSAVIGVGLTKLFLLAGASGESHLWICGALSVAIASIFMSHTHTLHPAAASTALICSINAEIRHLGWFYLADQVICGVIVISIACLFGNMYARYPLYWFLPPKLSAPKPADNKNSLHQTKTRKS